MSLLARMWGHDEVEERSTLHFTAGGMWPWDGMQQWVQTMNGADRGEEALPRDFAGLVDFAMKSHGVVFAAMLVRMLIFSEARFQWRALEKGRTGHLFGTGDLALLERPWPRGTTAQLLSRTMQDADLGGNALWARRPGTRRRPGPRLKRLRPDWTAIVIGIDADVDPDADLVDPVQDLDAEIIGYAYTPGGIASGNDPVIIPESEVVHWAPIPDPTAVYRGMSWLTPVIADIAADRQAIEHKARFFTQGATPNLIVKLAIEDLVKFEEWVDKFRAMNEGAAQAYKTMFLSAVADPEVVGSTFQQMDFRNLSSAAEARIAMASGVPATILGTSDGMQGSTLNAGNYGQARRRFADGTMRPLWRSMCGAFEYIVPRPAGAVQLWYDATDIPFLEEDQLDAAEIFAKKAAGMRQLTDGGYEPDTVIQAASTFDLSVLKHTGLLSVQMRPPGTNQNPDPLAEGGDT